MLLEIKIRLDSPFLGEKPKNGHGIRRFRRLHNGQVDAKPQIWRENLKLAARQLILDVDIDRTVVPPDGIDPASIHLYRRTYSGTKVELFESFRSGTVITMEFLLREDLPKHPDPDELTRILNCTGRYFPVSQFGGKFGFGKFHMEAPITLSHTIS